MPAMGKKTARRNSSDHPLSIQGCRRRSPHATDPIRTSDLFALSRQRLVAVAGTNGLDGTKYRIRRDTFARITIRWLRHRTLRDLLGHPDVTTTMIYARLLKGGGQGVRRPLDTMT